MWNSKAALVVAALGMVCVGQEAGVDLRGGLKINLPKDSPLGVASLDLGPSKGTARGGAVMLDLHASLRLRNLSGKRVKGVTLLVLAQDVTAGGKGSVAVPALDVAPGDDFPVRIDLRMVRPMSNGAEPLVRVLLDGVLFDDLSFFGENRLNSRRQLTVWELEARRDRKHFQQLLEAHGPETLQKEIIAAMARQQDRPRMDVQVVRSGKMPRRENAPATNYEMEHEVKFSFLRMPGAPIDVMAGAARMAGDEAKAPRLEIKNKEQKAIRHLEIGLALKDTEGQEFYAATVPYDDTLPGHGAATLQDSATLRARNTGGTRLVLESMAGFVNNVEYADGQYWIPSRADLEDGRLVKLVPPSPEEQRLVHLYRRKGLQGLVEELKK